MPKLLRNLLIGLGALVILVVLGVVIAGFYARSQILDSGGPLRPLEGVYDVRHYDLAFAVDPSSRTLSGHNTARLRAVASTSAIELDLDDRLNVTEVSVDGARARYHHDDGVLRIELPSPWTAETEHDVAVAWQGKPKVALKAPWIDGFVWSRTPEGGSPWVGVTCEGDGADIWWPCKDHPSDEPDEGVSIQLTVPTGLVGLSNGRPLGSEDNGDGTTTSRWEVTYPINNYDVTLNIAPYVEVEAHYGGVDGSLDLPIVFWSLPEHEQKARTMWQQAPKILEVFARRFGEYPFIRDKYWVAEAPYLGMEHQTVVAYGADFKDNAYGFDELLLHETAHEWWGNSVTAADWADFWLHEGFATYSEAVYVNDTRGLKDYLRYMDRLRHRISNRKPLVQGRDLTAARAYTGDIYNKGAWVLHMLRHILGDETFWPVLRGFATDSRFQYRTVTTQDWENYVQEVTGRDLGWFWDRYLRQAGLPVATVSRTSGQERDTVTLTWSNSDFKLPVELGWKGGSTVLGPESGWSADVPRGAEVTVDPHGWTLARFETRGTGVVIH